MSIISMKKVAVIGLDTKKEQLISDLMELGVVQITDQSARISLEEWKDLGVKDGDDSLVMCLDAEISRGNLALETLEKYTDEKSPLFKVRRAIGRSDFAKKMETREKICKDLDYIQGLNDQLHKLKEKINKRNADLSGIIPWVIYDLPLEDDETKYAFLDLGVVPSTVDIEKLNQRVQAVDEAVSLKEIHRDKDLIYMVIIAMKENREDVMTVLKQHGYTPTPFKGFKGTAAENEKRIEIEIEELQKQVKEITDKIADAYRLKEGIECLCDELVIERDRAKIKSSLIRTKRTFNLEGWVPTNCIEAVDKVLEENQCCFSYRDPDEEENVPVLVSNNSFAQPFEAITEMYSLPAYRGFDPTSIFSLFYAMFFGIMLSDAGYGMVIAVTCFIVLKKYELEGMTRKMVKMFCLCGISTIFWGAMFGGWFGDFIQVAAKVIFNKTVTVEPIWFNPLNDPVKLLLFSLIFGVVHIFIGMGINAYMLIKRGKLFDAICDVFSWYMVITGGAMWIAGGSVAKALVTPGQYIAIAGALILLLTGGRNNKGIGKIVGGLSSLYNVTGYVSDILSYSRLLALGLATGVIAQVVNTMGSLLGGGIAGTIVLLVVFVFGHTFNMAINTLGAFVHSSRLQYIEFFGKFYEDGGDEFVPFRKNTKYVRITNDTNGGKK